MRKIDKQTPLTDFSKFVSKNHPTRWEDLPSEISSESRFSILCNEQDCLCGYSEIILEESPASSHIDHFYKRDLWTDPFYPLITKYTLSTPTKKNPLQIIDSQGIYCTQTRARTGMGCPTGV